MFDRYIVVDWSANSTPKLGRDSIWIAQLDTCGGESITNHPTRHSAEHHLAELFEADGDSTTLVGVDFSLGYPAGTVAALGVDGAPWSAMWRLLAGCIVDDARNTNNRFAVAAELNAKLTGTASPFWGCPPSAAGDQLATTKPADAGPLASFRATEQVLRDQGWRPFSSWQLLGAGAVGSQSLLGIPMLERLRGRFDERFDVWPFTTGLRPPVLGAGAVVVAEVWPSMRQLDDDGGGDDDDGKPVRDALQVRATARWLADCDAVEALEALFAPALPLQVEEAVVAEEGWVLGAVP